MLLTCTVFSEAGDGAKFVRLLRGLSTTVANTMDDAMASFCDVLVLDMHHGSRNRLKAAMVVALKGRSVVLTGPDAEWLCRELELEIGGWNFTPPKGLRIPASALLGERRGNVASGDDAISPFASHVAEELSGSFLNAPHLRFAPVDAELELSTPGGVVDPIAMLAESESNLAVVVRQGNTVFCGVVASLDDWSDAYRELFFRIVVALAERDVQASAGARVKRHKHPSGTLLFQLLANAGGWTSHESSRTFYFLFDKPAVITASLRHQGSKSVALVFQGGRKKLHFSRQDAEHGETLTIAATIGQTSINALGDGYWRLDVVNFDRSNAMSARLTVRYATLASGDMLPLPSGASYEHFHRYAEGLSGSPTERHSATAMMFGFDDWQTLGTHIAWTEPRLPKDGSVGRQVYLLQAEAAMGGTYTLDRFLKFSSGSLEISADLRAALGRAHWLAATRQSRIGVEHLLLALLDDALAVDALTKCGADVDALGCGLTNWLDNRGNDGDGSHAVGSSESPVVSRELVGALWRATFHKALGRSGCNCANALVGVMTEDGHARELLETQGISRSDVILYLTFGIAKNLPVKTPSDGTGVLEPEVEAVLHAGFCDAKACGLEAFGVEHLLAAMLDLPRIGERVDCGTKLRRIRTKLAPLFIAATASNDRLRPTRALHRVVQKAVLIARSRGRESADAAAMLKAIMSESGTLAAEMLK